MVKYDIDALVSELGSLEWFDIIKRLNEISTRMDSIKNIKRHVEMVGSSEYQFNYYREFIREALFYFQTGVKPASRNIEEFYKLKPVVRRLIDNGKLKEGAIDAFS